jgi:hypothetical protein
MTIEHHTNQGMANLSEIDADTDRQRVFGSLIPESMIGLKQGA